MPVRNTSLFAALFGTLLFASCSKSNSTDPDPVPPPPPPAATDSLGAGISFLSTAAGPLSDIFFTDTLHGYTGGLGLYRTSDGGRTWTTLSLPNGFNLINMGARGNRAAFVAAGAMVLTTNDYGATLQPTIYTTAFGQPQITDTYFAGNDTVYYSSERYVLRSVTGGPAADTVFNFNTTANDEKALFFINPTTGWNLRQGKLFGTTNGGTSWTALSGPGGTSGGIHFVNSQVGYFGVNGTLFKTTDGGVTYSYVQGFGGGGYFDVWFTDAQNGIVVYGNRIFRTMDGGTSWTVMAKTATQLVEVHFADAHNGWVCSQGGLVYRIRI